MSPAALQTWISKWSDRPAPRALLVLARYAEGIELAEPDSDVPEAYVTMVFHEADRVVVWYAGNTWQGINAECAADVLAEIVERWHAWNTAEARAMCTDGDCPLCKTGEPCR